jgi:hypothetical protein
MRDISFGVPAFWIMGKAVTDALLALMVMVSLSYPPCRFRLSVARAPLRKAPLDIGGCLPFSAFMRFSAFFGHKR